MAQIQEWATVKLAKGKGAAEVDTPATIDIKSPGELGVGHGRVVNGGQAWFDNPHPGDYIEVFIMDKDGLIPVASRVAFPNYPIIGSFTEMECMASNKGFWIPFHQKFINVKALGDMGFVDAGFYIRVIGYKGDNSIDTFRFNVEWGKRE